MFNTFLYQPLLTTLTFLTNIFQGSFGLAILALTFVIRTAMIPLSLPAMRSTDKIKKLKPKLDDLKKRYTNDKKRLQQEQLNLYKEHGVNPAAGCLPTIVQFAVLIALYRVFIDFIQNGNGQALEVNMQFLWLDLSQPDHLYILPIIAGVSQLVLSKMIMPGTEHHEMKDLKKKARDKEMQSKKSKDKKSTPDMAEAIQQQMMYVMPAMTALIAFRLPSGLAVYWVATTVFSVIQQYIISGPGGLSVIVNRFKSKVK
jgi:YidC/Oxa1 family membrane protein insertase